MPSYNCIACDESHKVFHPHHIISKEELIVWPVKEEGKLTLKEYNTLEEMMLDNTELFL